MHITNLQIKEREKVPEIYFIARFLVLCFFTCHSAGSVVKCLNSWQQKRVNDALMRARKTAKQRKAPRAVIVT